MLMFVAMYILITMALWGSVRGCNSSNVYLQFGFFISIMILAPYMGIYLMDIAEIWKTGDYKSMPLGYELPVAIILGSAKFVGVIRG